MIEGSLDRVMPVCRGPQQKYSLLHSKEQCEISFGHLRCKCNYEYAEASKDRTKIREYLEAMTTLPIS